MNTNLSNEDKKRIIVCVHDYGKPISVSQLSRLSGLTDLSYIQRLIRSLCAERALRRVRSAETKDWMVCPFSQKNGLDFEFYENYRFTDKTDNVNSSILEKRSDKHKRRPIKGLPDTVKANAHGQSSTSLQKYDLVRRAGQGEKEALDLVFEYYLPKVKAIARSKSQLADADLLQVGLVGLLRGIKTFNPTKSINADQHLSLAVHRAIFEYTNNRHFFKAPDRLKRASRKILKSTEELCRSLNREPSTSELAVKTLLSEQKIREVKEYKLANTIISFVEQFESEEQSNLEEDILSDKSDSQPEVFLEAFELPLELDHAFKKLREKEKFVLHHRYGLAGNQVQTFEQIGSLLGGISRQRVKQIQSRALLKLKTEAVRRLAMTLGIGENLPLRVDNQPAAATAETLSVVNCSHPGTIRDSIHRLILTYICNHRGCSNKEKLILDVSSKIEDHKPFSPSGEVTACIINQLCAEGYLRLAFNTSELVITEKGFDWLQKYREGARSYTQKKSALPFLSINPAVPI